jgi:hypothetical protein
MITTRSGGVGSGPWSANTTRRGSREGAGYRDHVAAAVTDEDMARVRRMDEIFRYLDTHGKRARPVAQVWCRRSGHHAADVIETLPYGLLWVRRTTARIRSSPAKSQEKDAEWWRQAGLPMPTSRDQMVAAYVELDNHDRVIAVCACSSGHVTVDEIRAAVEQTKTGTGKPTAVLFGAPRT